MISTLLLTLALGTARADQFSASAPVLRPKFSKYQKLKMRVHRGWARLLLAERNKNDVLLRGLGTGDEVSPRNVVIAVGSTLPAAGLIYATKRLISVESARVRARVQRERTLTGLLAEGLPGVDSNAALLWPDLDKLAPARAELRLLKHPSFRTYLGDAARDLRVIALGAVTAALIYDGVQVWMRITMGPESFERRRAELQDIIDRVDYALIKNDAH